MGRRPLPAQSSGSWERQECPLLGSEPTSEGFGQMAASRTKQPFAASAPKDGLPVSALRDIAAVRGARHQRLLCGQTGHSLRCAQMPAKRTKLLLANYHALNGSGPLRAFAARSDSAVQRLKSRRFFWRSVFSAEWPVSGTRLAGSRRLLGTVTGQLGYARLCLDLRRDCR
jgi:hypothetical protein